METADRQQLAKVYNELGLEAYKTGHYDEAALHFETGIKYGDGTGMLAELSMNIAKAFSKEMIHDRAIEMADIAVEMEPTDSAVYKARGEVLARAGQIEAANKDFLKAYKIAPRNWPILTR